MGIENLEHLLENVKKIACLTDTERKNYIMSDHWIGYPKAEHAINKLSHLLNYPKRQRMPNFLIIGPTNNGKTMIVQKFLRMHPPKISVDNHHELLPVLSLQMPSSPDLKRFYSHVLYKINAPNIYNGLQITKLEICVLQLLKALEVKMIIIDEIHNVLAGSNNHQLNFLNALRFLGNELRIPIVCVGTRDAYMVIRSDRQLENRFEPFLLPKWDHDENFFSLLASFNAMLPLKRPSELFEPHLSEKIHILSQGILGEISSLLRIAAIKAIEDGTEKISLSTFKAIHYETPDARIKLFESSLI